MWIGAEFSGDIHEKIRNSRNLVEEEINKEIEDNSYEIVLDSWDCIAIIMEEDGYDEVVKYSAKKAEMDFRLKLDYVDFVEGTDLDRQKQLYNLLLRSLDLLLGKGLADKGTTELRADVKKVGSKQGWV
mgnify:CR=1 FL=1